MLIDNPIIVVDDIQRRLDDGKSPSEALRFSRSPFDRAPAWIERDDDSRIHANSTCRWPHWRVYGGTGMVCDRLFGQFAGIVAFGRSSLGD